MFLERKKKNTKRDFHEPHLFIFGKEKTQASQAIIILKKAPRFLTHLKTAFSMLSLIIFLSQNLNTVIIFTGTGGNQHLASDDSR